MLIGQPILTRCSISVWNIVDYQEHHHAQEKFGFAMNMMQAKRSNFLMI
jgi:hypothetical protein